MERDRVMETIYQGLKSEFPDETVDVAPGGFRNNIHVMVVSRKFDGKTERDKQDYIWSVIEPLGLTDEDKMRISLVVPYSPAELH